MNEVTVIVPVFNEQASLHGLIEEFRRSQIFEVAEVIFVDDGSRDGSSEILAAAKDMVTITHHENRGRGAAINTGLGLARSRFCVVFDADREYSVADLQGVCARASDGNVVYGSRYIEKENYRNKTFGRWIPLRGQSIPAFAINRLVALIVKVRFGHSYTDHFSGIRCYPTDFLQSNQWLQTGFAGDHEKAIRAIRAGLSVVEVPIKYEPRSKMEGKKIGAKDAVEALRQFLWS